MDVHFGPRTEVTEDRSNQGPKWMYPVSHYFRDVAASIDSNQASLQIVPMPTQPALQAEDLTWLIATPFGCYACQRIASPFIS